MQVYDDIQRLNQLYYEDHLQQLQDKVRKQREQIKKHDAAIEDKMRKANLSKASGNSHSSLDFEIEMIARVAFFNSSRMLMWTT